MGGVVSSATDDDERGRCSTSSVLVEEGKDLQEDIVRRLRV